MRLIKIVPIVGLCVASFLPATVTAGKVAKYNQIKNQASNYCLDATDKRDNAFVQQSKCDSSKDGQMWKLSGGTYVNKWTGGCLDVYSARGQASDLNTVTTSQCRNLRNQKWEDDCSKENAVIKNNCGARLNNAGTNQCLAAPGNLKLGPVKVVDCKDDSFLNWE